MAEVVLQPCSSVWAAWLQQAKLQEQWPSCLGGVLAWLWCGRARQLLMCSCMCPRPSQVNHSIQAWCFAAMWAAQQRCLALSVRAFSEAFVAGVQERGVTCCLPRLVVGRSASVADLPAWYGSWTLLRCFDMRPKVTQPSFSNPVPVSGSCTSWFALRLNWAVMLRRGHEAHRGQIAPQHGSQCACCLCRLRVQ